VANERPPTEAGAARHDGWQAGDGYEAYMGRWSRKVAPRFLDWLSAPSGCDWLDLGCGTGALSDAVLAQCEPRSLVSIDLSEAFIATARARLLDPRVAFLVGDAQALPVDDGTRDVIVSALVLNFVPDRAKALAEARRVARRGGVVGFYVWDYPGGGVEFMRAFWTAAVALDPAAAELAEDRRFPFCTPDNLARLASDAGLRGVKVTAIEEPTVFQSFDDFWRPFTLGAGPAPGYCMSLGPEARQQLKEKLRERLAPNTDNLICLNARAWALKAAAP
jgi:ubiquinone/menaquinone biosynthesis C-methylase UbiE